MYKSLLLPASILSGVIIGAGMFSLPFIFHSIGIVSGFFYLFGFALIYLVIYGMYAEVILRTPGEHRFVGYADIYLGKPGFWAAIWIGLIELFLVLTVYLILAPSFLAFFWPASRMTQLIIFWLFGSSVILFNTRRIALFEFLVMLGMIGIIVAIFVFGISSLERQDWNFGSLRLVDFLAAGPILFALSGVLGVPEVIRYFRESGIPLSKLKWSLALGGIIPVIVYTGFIFGVLGLSNGLVSEDSVSGLINAPALLLIGLGLLGVLSLISSYVVVGLNARRILHYDLGWPRWLARVVVIAAPLLLFLFGLQDFLKTVSLVGALVLPLESLFIIVMWLRARKRQ